MKQYLGSAKITVKDCLTATTINRTVKQYGEDTVTAIVVNIISQKMELFNVHTRMNTAQIIFFADAFIEKYKWDSLEDLVVCLNKAAMGEFGEIKYSIDPQKVFGWLTIHFEEKSQQREAKAIKEKHTFIEKQPTNELAAEWCKKIREELKAKEPKKLTLDEVRRRDHFARWGLIKLHLEQLDVEYLKKLLADFKQKTNDIYIVEKQTLAKAIKNAEK